MCIYICACKWDPHTMESHLKPCFQTHGNVAQIMDRIDPSGRYKGCISWDYWLHDSIPSKHPVSQGSSHTWCRTQSMTHGQEQFNHGFLAVCLMVLVQLVPGEKTRHTHGKKVNPGWIPWGVHALTGLSQNQRHSSPKKNRMDSWMFPFLSSMVCLAIRFRLDTDCKTGLMTTKMVHLTTCRLSSGFA